MIEVTATMFPSTVRNERSLLVQIAFSAMPTASRNWFMGARTASLLLGDSASRRRRFDLHRRVVGQLADRRERSDDDAVAVLDAGQDLEVLVAGDPGLDWHEDSLGVAHHEHAFQLLARLARFQL